MFILRRQELNGKLMLFNFCFSFMNVINGVFFKASYLASIFEGVVGAIWNRQLTNKWIRLLSHTWNKIPILPAVLLGFLVYAVAFEWPLVIVFSRKKILTKMKNTTERSLALYLACHESLNLYINAEVICNKQNTFFF